MEIFSGPNPGLAEIRLDTADLSPNEIQQIFSLPVKLIATYKSGNKPDDLRLKALMTAIISGAAYVEIEVESDSDFRNEIIRAAHFQGCRVIISYHNYEITPPRSELTTIIDQCFFYGADIAKIACLVNSEEENARLLSLYNYVYTMDSPCGSQPGSQKQFIAIGMGDKGKMTRIAAPSLGAPFTYASLSEQSKTAPGQIEFKKLETIFNLVNN